MPKSKSIKINNAEGKKIEMAQKVMKEIDKKSIRMKPRIFFIISSLFLSFGLFLSIALASFLVNLISFRLRIHAPFQYLRFGRPGYLPFLHVFPWPMLILAIASIVIGIVIIRKYDISYKKSFWGIAIGLIVFAIIFGIIIDKTGFNEPASKFPPMREMYHRESVGPDWLAGKIIQVSERQLTLLTPFEKKIIVRWGEDTLFPFGSDFTEDQQVRIIGQWQGKEFIAKGIDIGGDRLPIPPIPPEKDKLMPFQKDRPMDF
ncbi:MAG: hypothetical protein WC242_03145 [Candidatus Paceibacterota bacterium]|jgi:hypothetical protein